MSRKLLSEFLGTFWLVFGGCGSAVFSAAFPELGIGFLGVAFAFGLTVLTMAYAVGGISGGHFNPAVSVGLTVAGKFPAASLVPYIVVQVLGGSSRLRRFMSSSPARRGLTLAVLPPMVMANTLRVDILSYRRC